MGEAGVGVGIGRTLWVLFCPDDWYTRRVLVEQNTLARVATNIANTRPVLIVITCEPTPEKVISLLLSSDTIQLASITWSFFDVLIIASLLVSRPSVRSGCVSISVASWQNVHAKGPCS